MKFSVIFILMSISWTLDGFSISDSNSTISHEIFDVFDFEEDEITYVRLINFPFNFFILVNLPFPKMVYSDSILIGIIKEPPDCLFSLRD